MVKDINVSKYILVTLFSIMLIGTVSAASMLRVAPSYVNPGESFNVTYATSGVNSAYYVAFSDSIVNCTPTEFASYFISETPTNKIETKIYQAPMINGSCTFSGYYQFADGVLTNFPNKVIQVGTTAQPYVNNTNQTVVNPCIYNYSEWSVCDSNSTIKTRNYTLSNSNCTGTPILSEPCGVQENFFTRELIKIGTFSVKIWMVGILLLLIVLWGLSRK